MDSIQKSNLTIRRSLGLSLSFAGTLVGFACVFCSLWFIDFYLSYHSTTAYIPFLAWGVTYSNSGSVLNIFYGVLSFGVALGMLSAFFFGYWIRDHELQSRSIYSEIRNSGERRNSLVNVPKKIPVRNMWMGYSLATFFVIVGVLLLVYSFLFLSTFYAYGDTTSYFPWSWMALYTGTDSVLTLFYVGVAISSALIAVAIAILRVPKRRETMKIGDLLRKSLRRFSQDTRNTASSTRD
jgi:hypothetical protein